jgi:hypothetical protein
MLNSNFKKIKKKLNLQKLKIYQSTQMAYGVSASD